MPQSISKKTESMDEVKSPIIPNIIMHSFGGSKEIAQSLSNLQGANVYFSFCNISSEVSLHLTKKTEEVVKSLPSCRLLIETDSPHQIAPSLTEEPNLHALILNRRKDVNLRWMNEPRFVSNALSTMARLLNVDAKAAGRLIFDNSIKCIKRL